MYSEKDLVRIAKRENNNKRKYLVVNPLQGKHIPVSPHKAFEMFNQLADIIADEYKNEKLLLVGFAETATAIGAALAVSLNTYYMQTTREVVDGVQYLFFSEAHSHATEQKLIKDDLECVKDKISRIMFVEDEVTTGNTILNIINILEKEYPGKFQFSVASLLNGMDNSSLKRYAQRGIRLHYLLKTSHENYTQIAEGFADNGTYCKCDCSKPSINVKGSEIGGWLNARRCVVGGEYKNACDALWQKINEQSHIGSGDSSSDSSILVIGTEEFMYPALYTAKRLEEKGYSVKCHSTTRSPIVVCNNNNYPLHKRYELVSLYDDSRKTFIYDIGSYDKVIIITDAKNKCGNGENSLVNAVISCGNSNIEIFRWC